MHLATDYIHPYRGGAGQQSRCRIRLYLPEEDRDAAVVICSTYEVRGTMRGGLRRLEIGEPTWKRLDRAAVEVLVGQEA